MTSVRLAAMTCLCALAFPLSSGVLRAEHRVALLIGIDQYDDASLVTDAVDLSEVSDALVRRGFRCHMSRNLTEQQLKETIEGFAGRTPTRGTALIYFAGQVLPGSYKGTTGICLLGTNSISGRGYLLQETFKQLHAKGGSQRNLIVLDSSPLPKRDTAIPSGCGLACVNAASLVRALGEGDDLIDSLAHHDRNLPAQSLEGFAIVGDGSAATSSPQQFQPGTSAGQEWVNHRGMVFCWCPPGRFIKGSPIDETGRYADEVQESVTIEHGFWISKYELTLRENPRNNRPRNTIAVSKNDPLTMVNYDDARRMTQKTLTESERKAGRLPGDWRYSLTTEDQWEYAARAGTKTAWHFGDDVDLLPRFANFADRTFFDTGDIYSQSAHRTLSDGVAHLAEVGTFRANAWGIHDMHGNVAEWCIGTAIRGGSWVSTPESCRSAHRHTFSSRNEQNFIGYRLVIERVP